MSEYLAAQCWACTRRLTPARICDPGVATCSAYPDGIPVEILGPELADHRQPRGDERDGLTFELADGPEAADALDDWQRVRSLLDQ